MAGTLHLRGVLELAWDRPEVLAQQEYPKDLDERWDDKAGLCVEQVEVLHNYELGNGEDLGGQSQRSEKDGEHDLPASELEAGERIGGKDANQRRPYHDATRHQDRVE